MHYKESKLILEEIKRANRILLNCHRDPDPDSIGSATALYKVLVDMGKNVSIVSPSDVRDWQRFIPFSERVEKVDFSTFDTSVYDLCIFLDSSSWDQVSNDKSLPMPKSKIILIDHHDSNTKWGHINLVRPGTTSTSEIIFKFFEDINVEIDKSIASSLMVGIIADTGVFRYPGVGAETLEIALKLIKRGADKDFIVFNIYSMSGFNLVKFWGEVLSRLEIEKSYRFVWSAIPYETFSRYKISIGDARSSSVSLFGQAVRDTEFGFVAIEYKPNTVSLSFRSRTGFDTSKIAAALGGGGHIWASGGKVEGLSFDKAVEKVLRVARKYAKKSKK